jgi:hypothetical protein
MPLGITAGRGYKRACMKVMHGCIELKRERTTITVPPKVRERLMDVKRELGARSAGEVVEMLLDLYESLKSLRLVKPREGQG